MRFRLCVTLGFVVALGACAELDRPFSPTREQPRPVRMAGGPAAQHQTTSARRQYYDQRRQRYYFYDPGRQAYFWEDGSPRT